MNKDKLVEPMVVDEKGNIYYSAKVVNELYQKNEALKSGLMIDHHKIHNLVDIIERIEKYIKSQSPDAGVCGKTILQIINEINEN